MAHYFLLLLLLLSPPLLLDSLAKEQVVALPEEHNPFAELQEDIQKPNNQPDVTAGENPSEFKPLSEEQLEDFESNQQENEGEENLTLATTPTITAKQKLLYLQYENIPKRVIEGEVFGVTIKTLSVLSYTEDVEYKLEGSRGLKILNDGYAFRVEDGRYYHDTFYFQAISKKPKLPTFYASIKDEYGKTYPPEPLSGVEITTIKLNPKKDFCNVVAKSMSIGKYKTSTYDEQSNIVVFSLESNQSLLEEFNLPNAVSQGIESIQSGVLNSKMIYFAVVDKQLENLTFSYFSTLKNSYIALNIPIIVEDDTVSTQSDLKPKDQSRQKLKMFIALGVVLLGVILVLWRGRYVYILLIVLPAIYIVVLLMPEEKICIKADTKIRILPLENGTVFEVTLEKKKLSKIGSTKNFAKVELGNKKIGWVRNEDLCDH